MRILREDVEWGEVAASWVRAELQSPRFGGHYRRALDARPDASPDDLLTIVRGWPDTGYFEGFPRDVTWMLVALTPRSLREVLYIDWGYWVEATRGTRRPLDAIRELGWSEVLVPEPDIEPLILVTESFAADRRVVLVEGHARLTRYVAAEAALPSAIQCWLGVSPNMTQWGCY